MQLTFQFAPATRAVKAPLAEPTTAAPEAVTVAEALNLGSKVAFPKNANAIRVTIGTKTVVILKADADTLKGAGVATTVEFGTIRNDSKGHPLRKEFQAVAAS